jgi:hypothetical protein
MILTCSGPFVFMSGVLALVKLFNEKVCRVISSHLMQKKRT